MSGLVLDTKVSNYNNKDRLQKRQVKGQCTQWYPWRTYRHLNNSQVLRGNDMEEQNRDGNHHGNETDSPSQSCFRSITATTAYASNKKHAGQAIASSLPRASPEEQEIKHWTMSHTQAWVAPTGEVPSGPPETKLRRIPENLLMEF